MSTPKKPKVLTNVQNPTNINNHSDNNKNDISYADLIGIYIYVCVCLCYIVIIIN